nr:MAG TPA: hypothetical protein [Caudoviricetes sp.]
MSGPLFETTTDHLIISPKSGAVLFTYYIKYFVLLGPSY